MLTGCKEKLHTLGSVLNKTWTEFYSTAVFRLSHCKHLMVSAHRKQVLFMLSSVVSLSSSKLEPQVTCTQSRHVVQEPHTNCDVIFLCILQYLNISDLYMWLIFIVADVN